MDFTAFERDGSWGCRLGSGWNPWYIGMMNGNSIRIFPRSVFALLGILIIYAVAAVPAPAADAKVAMLGLENLNRDPRYDYLEGMITGVLMYDLIRVDGVTLVERARLDSIFMEQELALTGLLNDAATARQVGQLAGADYLIEGDYAFLGREMIVNLSLMNVADGSTTPFSARGYTENTIHELAEKLVEELTGEAVILAGIEGERSLLSLTDEEPGEIEFYCNFQGGEIYVDESFYGYTPGGTTPTLLEDLSPGVHTIRVEAGPNFGEIQWPEVAFEDWQRDVEIKAGRKKVVRARVYHFNDQLYNARRIYSESWRLEPGKTEEIIIDEDITYQDRQGRNMVVALKMEARLIDDEPVITFSVSAGGESEEWIVDPAEDEVDLEGSVGGIEVEFEKDWYSSSYWYIEIQLERTDIYQGMHRE